MAWTTRIQEGERLIINGATLTFDRRCLVHVHDQATLELPDRQPPLVVQPRRGTGAAPRRIRTENGD